MDVWINGQRRSLPDGATVADAVAVVSASRSGVAVAVAGDVLPRAGWASRRLAPGDRVEVLTAVPGG